MAFDQTVLGEFVKVQGGYAYKSKDFQDAGDCRVLKIKNVRFGHIDYGDTAFISESLGDETKNWQTNEGDILISMTGSGPNAPQSLVGRVGRVWRDDPIAWINQRVGRIQVKEGTLHPDFIFYLLSQQESQDFLVANSSGSANQANISGKTIELLPCPKVDYEESEKIASILRSLDEKVIINRQTNQTLEHMAQALFKSWFVDFDPVIDNALLAGNEIPEPLQARAEMRKALLSSQEKPDQLRALFPSEFEHTELSNSAANAGGWVPKGWEASTVGNCFDVTMGQSPPGSTYNENQEGMPFFQGKTDFGFRYPSNRIYCTEPKRVANKHDTLISVRAPVGDVNMALEKCILGRGVASARHKSEAVSYTYYAMKQLEDYFKVFESEGTVFGSINQKDFKALPSIKPGESVVQYFETMASGFERKIELNTLEINELEKLRDTLLPKLISGELRLPDIESAIEATA